MLVRFRSLLALSLTVLAVGCAAHADDGATGSEAVVADDAPWTTEAQVADTASYKDTVLSYYAAHAERGTFVSDHPKQNTTRQGDEVDIAYAVVHAQKEIG